MESSPLFSIGLPVSLFIIMVGIGLTLTVRDFGQVTLNPKGMIVGTIAQILLMPMAAFAIASMLSLTPALAVGLVVIAACPGGATSNLFTLLSRGNVALSILLTVSASLIAILSLPFFTNLALVQYFGESAEITLPVGKTITMLAVIVLLPVATGMLIRSRWPERAQRMENGVSRFGAAVLLLLSILLLWESRDRLVQLFLDAGPATLLLNLAGIIVGLGFSRVLGLSRWESMAVAVELGIKNGTLAFMVTLTLLESSEMSVPVMVYSLLMYMVGFLLVVAGQKLIPASSPAT
ncbi:bile acid:sodium symporter family protein [Halomonas eurihalina]|uniref:Bile acid:sodium symporter family protein n=1 Tax=Halomonas eurihalina TaxID=42566 RepID=A0A5D9DDQ9_HALER|nr:bile acid:sodium symporter family protein [Halomonas eurihalina]MDR5859257.1 bile acid:sodium symporter family protein [Halomonas eurihalina]TZG40921.1 bile acid:sodium symporter family protein [Halomonas eurihalina]